MSAQSIGSTHRLISSDNSNLISIINRNNNLENVLHNKPEERNPIKCKDIMNNVVNDSNNNMNSSSKNGNNCGLNINNMFAMPFNNVNPIYLFNNSEHNSIRTNSGHTPAPTPMTAHHSSAHLIHKSHLNSLNNNSLNLLREGNTPSPLSLSSISNHLSDSPGNAFSMSKIARTSDGLISGLNFNQNDVLREGGFMNYQNSPAENATSTPNSFTTSSLDGYLTGGQGGHSSNHSFDLLDSDSFSEMPNSLSPSCQPTYDDNSGHSYGDHKKNANIDPNSLAPMRKKRKNGPPVRPACPDCGKEFSNQSALSKHKLTHSDERKFVCNQCAKAFKRQDHLNGHLLTHRSKKPYECDVEGCEKTYCDARSLRRHKENHHPTGPNNGSNQSLQTVFIPGIALNFSTPNVGLSTPNVGLTTNQTLNRIQYAPAPQPPVTAPVAPVAPVSGEQSAATQLQRLALHKQDNNVNSSDKWVSPAREGGSASAQKWNQNSSVINKHSFINSNEIGKQLLKSETTDKMQSISNSNSNINDSSQENALLHQLLTQEHFKEKQQQQQQQQQQHHQQPQQHPVQPPHQHPPPLYQMPPQPQLNQPPIHSSAQPQHHNHNHSHSQQPHHQQQPHQHQSHHSHKPQTSSQQSLPAMASMESTQQSMADNWPYTMFSQNSHKSEPQQVECSLCQRKFKNIPALNGHMRLHGGYLKNQSQNSVTNGPIGAKKENTKADSNQVNANVKAILDVIKEKISRKQANASNLSNNMANSVANNMAPQLTQQLSQMPHLSGPQSQQQVVNSPMAPILSPVTPVTPTTSGNTSSFNYDFENPANNELHFIRQNREMYYNNEILLLKEQLQQSQQFRMPSQPSNVPNRFQAQEQRQHQTRRHSDSSDCAESTSKLQTSPSFQSSDCYSTQQFNDLLRRRTQRTCSDPGSDQPLMTINTNYNSPQPQMFNHQFYHQSHSVPTTPTLCHNSSTLQPQSYPHSLPSTPTAAVAPVTFIHSPHRGSLPSTPTDVNQQFNFVPVPSPIAQGSVHSQYSTSPASVAQYSPNTPYSPSHTAVQQFTYSVPQSVPQQQNTTNVYEERMEDNYEDSQMYDAITNYTNTGAAANAITEEHFNFDNNLNANNNYFEPQNEIMSEATNNMQIDNQSMDQMSIQSIPQSSKQQFFSSFSAPNASHEYNPNVTSTSNYVQSSNCWTQSSLTNSVQINEMKAVLPSVPPVPHQPTQPNLTPKLETCASNLTNCYSVTSANNLSAHPITSSAPPVLSSHSSNSPYIQTSKLHMSGQHPHPHRSGTLQRSSTSSPPHLVVNLEKIDECDEEADDVFLSPVGVAPSPKRISPAIPALPKRPKHRPEPLYIPPHVNTCGYQSRLRSPRLWDPAAVADTKNLSPPPYTPPPMLSPVRSGPGLFWHIISGSMTPKSGTITPKFVYSRKSSSDVKEKEEPISQSISQTPTTAYEPFDCEIPETDIQPHVNIGPNFQARIPAFNKNRDEAIYRSEKADLVWDPTVAAVLTDEDIESYLELSCCACVPGSGRNKEYAMHLLNITKGDVNDAIVKLLEPHPTIDEGHPLHDYHYSENDIWVPQEIESYQCALNKCDKDFFSISKEIGTKTVKQCIQFYYMWKKVCPDEYRRLRVIRRKRENETIFYNLRSKEGEDNNNSNNNNNNSNNNLKFDTEYELDTNETEMNGLANSGQSSDVDSLMDSANPSPATSIGSTSTAAPAPPVVEYPCKLCGKVFPKVKSRSAHMKIHGSGSAKY